MQQRENSINLQRASIEIASSADLSYSALACPAAHCSFHTMLYVKKRSSHTDPPNLLQIPLRKCILRCHSLRKIPALFLVMNKKLADASVTFCFANAPPLCTLIHSSLHAWLYKPRIPLTNTAQMQFGIHATASSSRWFSSTLTFAYLKAKEPQIIVF